MVTATVHGARGYLGRVLLRLLLEHPKIDGIHAVSGSVAGEPVEHHIPGLSKTGLNFVPADHDDALDAPVAFLATSDEGAATVQEGWQENGGPDIAIDLSRLRRQEAITGEGWVYGIADIEPVSKGTTRIANPGCYPTASLLASAPLLRAGLTADGVMIADGKSGVSGAGATPRADLHYPTTNENVRAYKVLGHDHCTEIQAAAGRFQGSHRPVRFTPHLVPQNRGLLSTVYIPLQEDVAQDEVEAVYEAAYADTPFVRVVDEPQTADVRLSNRADVAVDVDPDTHLAVARCAIDNLVKGGAGQAIQNLNDALGIPNTTGLPVHGGGP